MIRVGRGREKASVVFVFSFVSTTTPPFVSILLSFFTSAVFAPVAPVAGALVLLELLRVAEQSPEAGESMRHITQDHRCGVIVCSCSSKCCSRSSKRTHASVIAVHGALYKVTKRGPAAHPPLLHCFLTAYMYTASSFSSFSRPIVVLVLLVVVHVLILVLVVSPNVVGFPKVPQKGRMQCGLIGCHGRRPSFDHRHIPLADQYVYGPLLVGGRALVAVPVVRPTKLIALRGDGGSRGQASVISLDASAFLRLSFSHIDSPPLLFPLSLSLLAIANDRRDAHEVDPRITIHTTLH